MRYHIKDIAQAIGAVIVGDETLSVSSVGEPAFTSDDMLAIAMKPEFAKDLPKGAARVALMWADADYRAYGLDAAILAPRPRFALSHVTPLFDQGPGFEPGIDPSARIHPSVKLGADVNIGAFTWIAPGATIGDHAVIGPHCSIGAEVMIGAHALLREHVTISARSNIGDRFVAQPGVRVGGDGFSFVTPEQSSVERARDSLGDQGKLEAQSWARIHSLGSVEVGHDVELGANVCIDKGTLRNTVIGNGVKIDNLAQIGHNVVIGEDCLICAQVGIAGSSRLGRNVVLGGQTGISDNVFIGDNVITGGATKVLSNIPSGRVMLGYPAMQMDKQLELYKLLRKLPRRLASLAKLEKAVFNSDSLR